MGRSHTRRAAADRRVSRVAGVDRAKSTRAMCTENERDPGEERHASHVPTHGVSGISGSGTLRDVVRESWPFSQLHHEGGRAPDRSRP